MRSFKSNEASEMAKENLLIARSLVSPRTSIVPVKVINQSASSVKLKKGVVLGTLQPMGSIMSTRDYYDISQHREGISVCQLKSDEDRHHRQQLIDAEIRRNSKTTPSLMTQTFLVSWTLMKTWNCQNICKIYSIKVLRALK